MAGEVAPAGEKRVVVQLASLPIAHVGMRPGEPGVGVLKCKRTADEHMKGLQVPCLQPQVESNKTA